MADYVWPDDLVPYVQSFYLQPHVVRSESPFSRFQKVYGLSAARWVTKMSFRGGYNGVDAQAGYGPRLDALIAQLEGGAHRIAVGDMRRPDLRGGGRTVNTSSQAALKGSTSLTIVGLEPGARVLTGDYVGGDGRPHIILADGEADNSGKVTVTVRPPFSIDIKAGAGQLGDATGLFRLVSDDAGENATEVGSPSQYLIEMAEDLAAVNSTYNPMAEFAGRSGAMWDVSQWQTTLYQDAAATTPVTASGQPVGCIKNLLGDEDWDLVQSTSGERPEFQINDGIPSVYADPAGGDGLEFRAQRSMSIPVYILAAMQFSEANVNASFGLINNVGDKLHLGATSSLSRIQTTIASPTIGRSQVVAQTPFYVSRPDVPFVADTLAVAGLIDAKANGGISDPIYSPQSTTFQTGDEMISLTGGFNISSESLEIGVPDSTKGGVFYFGMVLFGEPSDRDALNAYVLDLISPEVRPDDLVILIVGDSTGDDISSTDNEMNDEMFRRWAAEELPGEYPNATIYYRTWARTGDVYTGWEKMADGAGDARVFVSNASVSGSQPSYGLAGRFPDMYGSLPHVDEIIVNHGHNMAVQTTDNDGLLRLGEWLDASDKLRIQFPDAPQLWIRTHPHRTQEIIAPVVEAMDNAAALYGDVEVADIYQHFDSNGRPVGWYLDDNVHPSVPVGVDEQLFVFVPTYAGWTRPTSVTPALILQTAANLLTNGDFSSFTGPVPDGWTLSGSAAVARDEVVVDYGQDHSARITQASGNAFIYQALNAVPYRGQTMVLAVRQFVPDGDSLTAGRISLITDGTGAVDPSAWNYDTVNQSVDAWRWGYIHVNVPMDATTITVRLYGSASGAADVRYGRAVLRPGQSPKNIA